MVSITEIQRRLRAKGAQREAKQLQNLHAERIREQAKAFRSSKQLGELKKLKAAKEQIAKLRAFKTATVRARFAKLKKFSKKAKSAGSFFGL